MLKLVCCLAAPSIPMPTQTQVEADRRNSHNSTHLPSEKGEGPPRFDRLKSSIDANTHVIPGEDAGQLQAVIQSYKDKFLPGNALEWFLVDGMISANWELRRLRMVEAQLWQRELAEGGSLEDVYTRNPALLRLERQKLATLRSHYRVLKEMQQIIKAEDEAFKGMDWGDFSSREEKPDPKGGPGSPAGGDSKAPASESGSLLPKDEAGEAPGPELGSFLAKDVAGKGACPGIGFVPPKPCRRRGAAGHQIGFVPSSQRRARGARVPRHRYPAHGREAVGNEHGHAPTAGSAVEPRQCFHFLPRRTAIDGGGRQLHPFPE